MFLGAQMIFIYEKSYELITLYRPHEEARNCAGFGGYHRLAGSWIIQYHQCGASQAIYVKGSDSGWFLFLCLFNFLQLQQYGCIVYV